MTQDKTNLQPNTFVFHNTNVDWVMRITADRRIEVNEGVEVTEAAQKVLDAMQQLLKAQRTWVGLTDDEIWDTYMESPAEFNCHTDDLNAFCAAIEAKLKEKNI